ncbi:MAG: membrane fusion protein (multidrug efflux system) [Bacteroidia bacterium]|jgi:membrane fusion protein (multidrug efflux system)
MAQSFKIRRSIVIAVLLILVTVLVFRKISSKEEKIENTTSFRTLNVVTTQAKNLDRHLKIDLSGKLVAKNRIDIFSEVNGVLQTSNFREGHRFSKGQVLAQMDDSELRANLKSQKSTLLNSVSQVLPDLVIDYPEEIEAWKKFHASIDFDKPVPDLPEIKNEKAKVFISSKNIFTTYYSIKSQELRLSKHKILAPFSGVLSATDLDPGTLVRAGQRLGTFIQPNQYELEASISLDDLKFIKVGSSVKLASSELHKQWTGKILRINEQLDPSTQSVKVYIGVTDNQLKEGQYLTAIIEGSTLQNVIEVQRNLLLENDELFFVERDSVLSRRKVNVVYKGTDWVYISDIKEGDQYLNQAVSSAHDGMIVKILNKEG